MMSNNAKIAAAVVGGYFLGRTKKAKMAIGFGMFLAGKKLSLDPKQLSGLLGDSKLLGGLNDQVRGELLDATKSAATTALTNRIGGFADTLHERAQRLEGGGDGEQGEQEENDEDGAARGTAADTDTDTAEDEAPREERPAKRTARKTAQKGRTRAAAPAKKSAPAKKTAAKGTRKAASGARGTSSTARKTASGTARRATRGGGNG
ncbi:hypothetical protein [Streptomyces sp. NPDC050560]|uniref:hypothetical protein n=1 Tax=Streptomyces sp. NPDC050560 TaxID=3365630 RepID=UPI0037B70761